MKKKRTAASGFLNLRVLMALLLCAAAGCSVVSGTLLAFFRAEAPAKTSQRILTFEERVAYQRAIEEVYWRHRIWPKENPDPKPSLGAMMPQAEIEKKVEDYLRDSQALEAYWRKPITPDQLQAEIERMARDTKQPEVLRELFEALGNDPFVIAECLARPVLIERVLADSLAQDKPRGLGAAKTKEVRGMPMAATLGNAAYTLPKITEGDPPCNDDTWTATSTANAATGRTYHNAVWTGSEMIVWGGFDGSNYLNTGGRYTPSMDSWVPTSTTNAPTARAGGAIWTGSEMIVWGGFDGFNFVNTGGRYNPATDSWTATSTTNAPDGRSCPEVWTGSEMIIWGGANFNGELNTGGRYDPSTDSWVATSTINAPTARAGLAVWAGSEMIVWGGFDGSNYLNTGGRYTPSTDSWMATSTTNAPAARQGAAVWAGSEMIVWGGSDSVNYFNTGGRYNPSTDSWIATSTTGAPTGRYAHTQVWTGSQMIVWGGSPDGGTSFLNTGGRYNPITDSWTATSTTNAPTARYFQTGVWTGTQMIVWGGFDNSNYFDTGGSYCAQGGPSPTPTPTASPTPTSTATPTATQLLRRRRRLQ